SRRKAAGRMSGALRPVTALLLLGTPRPNLQPCRQRKLPGTLQRTGQLPGLNCEWHRNSNWSVVRFVRKRCRLMGFVGDPATNVRERRIASHGFKGVITCP